MITPNRADLAAYLDMVFGYVDQHADSMTCIALRGTGEKGTPREGVFIEPIIVAGIESQFDIDRIYGHVQRWSLHGCASFIVPAAIDMAAMGDHKATEERVRLLTTIVVDIDKGDTTAALAHASKHLGTPTMVVHSGGTTETGAPKLHVYWRLTEPSDRVVAIAAARKVLALKLGGDPSFGRSTQVIRLPGSVYGKNGVAKPCAIADMSNYEYDLGEILASIEVMPMAPGVTVSDPAKLAPLLTPAAFSGGGKGLQFSAFKAGGGDADNRPDIRASLTTQVVEGGDEDKNRWSEFNRVAGHYIHTARVGGMTLDEAKDAAHGWMAANMKPAWPPVRFETEWKNLLAKDTKTKGPMPGATDTTVLTPMFRPAADLDAWNIDRWTMDTPPPVKFLVPGLIAEGVQHLLVAAGGAGKTFLLLDLALKIAAKRPGDGLKWLNMLLPDEAAGTAIMLTMEDDKPALQRRIHKLDPDKKLRKVPGMGKRCKIIPALNAGGAFPLVERERGTGTATVGKRWAEWLELIREIPDLRLVVIDTLNSTMHGDENNATIINEYMQAAAVQICGEKGAALIVTHHVRKPGANTKIYTGEDFLHEIRGSGALPGAFRLVLGVWQAPDYRARMSRLGLAAQEGQFFSYGVVKTNIEDTIYPNTRAALRQENGILGDITDLDMTANHSAKAIAEEWLVKAVEVCANDFRPLTKTSPTTGVFARRMVLPEALKTIPKHALQKMVDDLVERKDLVLCDPDGGKSLNYLDIPGGRLARGEGDGGGSYRVADGSWNPPDWERTYAWDPLHCRVVSLQDRHPMTR